MLKTAKLNFFNQLNPSTPKKFRKIAKYFTKKMFIPVLKGVDGQTISDDAEKATIILNNYYA